jgi:enamine deaminase RidA (YjgF/YER057c/UK114 family)
MAHVAPRVRLCRFSDGVLVGDTLYIAGHIGIDPKSDRAAEDPRIEAKFVMDRVRPSSPLVDVVLMQVFCTDLALYDTFNEVYRNYFPHGFPARAFLGANSLLRGDTLRGTWRRCPAARHTLGGQYCRLRAVPRPSAQGSMHGERTLADRLSHFCRRNSPHERRRMPP